MREAPRIFTAESVQAILAGRKTQTRRLLRLPEDEDLTDLELDRMQPGYPEGPRPVWHVGGECNVFSTRNPFGGPGDRIWVKETLRYNLEANNWYYAADMHGCGTRVFRALGGRPTSRTLSPVFMPRIASRLLLEITDVRVEQLQAITADDIVAEGMQYPVSVENCPPGTCKPLIKLGGRFPVVNYLRGGYRPSPETTHEEYLRAYFVSGWNEINYKRATWESNPWVWVISFRVLTSEWTQHNTPGQLGEQPLVELAHE